MKLVLQKDGDRERKREGGREEKVQSLARGIHQHKFSFPALYELDKLQ